MAGIRSLPVTKESSFRWFVGVDRARKSQNQHIVGSEVGSASVFASLLFLSLGLGCDVGQFSYVATARRVGTSRGSSEPRTINSISSGRNNARAFPPQTV